MKIVWDEVKRQANIRKHRLDFSVLDDVFFQHAVLRPGRHGRLKAIGQLESGVIAVIFVTLGTEGPVGHFDATSQPVREEASS